MPSLAVESLLHRPSPSCHIVRRPSPPLPLLSLPRRPLPPRLPLPLFLPSPLPPLTSRHGRAFRRRRAVQRVPSPSCHPSPSPLRRRRVPFPLSLLVDCCLFTPPPLSSRLPLPLLSSTLRHRRIVLGEAIIVTVVVIIVLPSTPPTLPSIAASHPC